MRSASAVAYPLYARRRAPANSTPTRELISRERHGLLMEFPVVSSSSLVVSRPSALPMISYLLPSVFSTYDVTPIFLAS